MLTAKQLEQIQRYCLMDDAFMRQCLKENIPAVELILHIVLGRRDFHVTAVRVDEALPNLHGRGARLDVHAVDDNGRHFNVEIQRDRGGAAVRRARYNSALLDSSILPAGHQPDELPDTFVVFITEKDYRGLGRPMYFIDRIWRDDGTNAGTGDTIIYVNGEYRADDDIGWLMHDFNCANADEMRYDVLAETTRRHKKTEAGLKTMGLVSDEIRNEGRVEGRVEGRIENLTANLRSLMSNLRLTAEQAMNALSVPLEDRPRYALLLAGSSEA